MDIKEMQDARFKFLHKLWELTEGNERALVKGDDIGHELGFDNDLTDRIESYLEGEYLLKVPARGAISITHEGIKEIEAVLYEKEDIFENIILEPVQEELLITIVEAARNVSLDQRQKFSVTQSFGRNSLIHPGISENKSQIYYGDIEALDREDLLALGFESEGSPNFDVTSLGFKFYEYLKNQLGEPVERVEKTIRNYLIAHDFQKKYPIAYEKWSAAEKLLWKTDTPQQFTTIGHLCRESVQEFANILVEQFQPPNISEDKSKTVARLKGVIDIKANKLGSTEKPFLKALITYWGTVNDLIQRQEHGAQKEGHGLIWEDARRVVFQTLVVMFEIDKTLIK